MVEALQFLLDSGTRQDETLILRIAEGFGLVHFCGPVPKSARKGSDVLAHLLGVLERAPHRLREPDGFFALSDQRVHPLLSHVEFGLFGGQKGCDLFAVHAFQVVEQSPRLVGCKAKAVHGREQCGQISALNQTLPHSEAFFHEVSPAFGLDHARQIVFEVEGVLDGHHVMTHAVHGALKFLDWAVLWCRPASLGPLRVIAFPEAHDTLVPVVLNEPAVEESSEEFGRRGGAGCEALRHDDGGVVPTPVVRFDPSWLSSLQIRHDWCVH